MQCNSPDFLGKKGNDSAHPQCNSFISCNLVAISCIYNIATEPASLLWCEAAVISDQICPILQEIVRARADLIYLNRNVYK